MLSATATTNQFIASASQKGCWSRGKQRRKINGGKCIVISISIMDSVSSLSHREKEKEMIERDNKIDVSVINILQLFCNEAHSN